MQNPLLQSSMIHRLQSVASALSVQTWWTAWPPVYATSCLIRLWTDCWARGLWESVIASKILIGWWYFRPIDSWFITSLGKCKMVIKKKSGSILGEMRMFQNISGVNWAADFFFSLHSLKCTFTEHHSVLEQDVWIQICDSRAFLKLLLYPHRNQMSSGLTFFIQNVKWSVMSDSLWHHWYSQSARLLCPWNSTGKNSGVGCHFLLQGIFSIQGWNLGLPHCRQIFYHLSHQGSLS